MHMSICIGYKTVKWTIQRLPSIAVLKVDQSEVQETSSNLNTGLSSSQTVLYSKESNFELVWWFENICVSNDNMKTTSNSKQWQHEDNKQQQAMTTWRQQATASNDNTKTTSNSKQWQHEDINAGNTPVLMQYLVSSNTQGQPTGEKKRSPQS